MNTLLRSRFGFVKMIVLLAGFLLCSAPGLQAENSTNRMPHIFPDYTEITLPPNIAPLNFVVQETGSQYRIEFRSTKGEPIQLTSITPGISIPMVQWKRMLEANRGEPLLLAVSIKSPGETWLRFTTVTNYIAREDVDGWLVYRLLHPLFNMFNQLGIYQRNVQNFEETEVLQNRNFDQGCLNCHSFLKNRPDTFALHIRSEEHKSPMMLVLSNEVVKLGKTAGYMSWHPSGRLIAFSANKPSLFFHATGECREVYDANANLGFYRVDSNSIVVPPPLATAEFLETWPGWGHDGQYLYFCRAPLIPIERYREIRFDLMRVHYDITNDQWGPIEPLVSARDSRMSAAQPKASPDGRFLVFCLFERGNFPVYQASSDLYIMDLQTLKYRRMECNSDQSESWHSWSSNSRWLVFSSKRWDGLFARPFFTYIDEQGREHKPFVLPQKDPAFYDSYIKTFNVPELIKGPIQVTQQDLARAIKDPVHKRIPKLEGSHTQDLIQKDEVPGGNAPYPSENPQ